METVDTLISARWVIPVNAAKDVLDHHTIAIRDGEIIAILPTEEAAQKYQADNAVDLPDQALIPGFVNAHGHSAMAMFRGMADDLALMTWLQDHIWPAEGKWVSYEMVKDGTRLAAAEMIRSGTTTFSDNYFFPDASAESTLESGLRAQLCFPTIDFPTAWAKTPDEHIDYGLKVIEQYKGHSHIKVNFGPHAPYSCSDEPLLRIKELAAANDLEVQMHVHETQVEVDGEMEKRGNRPVRRLRELGLLNEKFQMVHMTALTEEDIKDVVETGAHVIHCPESNLKLASGYCPVDTLMKAGVNVALGTDGAASNNDLDMIGEMQTAALIAKTVAMDAEALPAYDALTMATLNGAKALRWDDKIGSLEVGKRADITAINLGTLEAQPVFDPVSHIVYATTREQVSNVWVDGKQLLRERQLLTLNESEIVENAREWRDKIQAAQ